jgi:hypothetical protein
MVIWLFAGGGESELGQRDEAAGIVKFLERVFPGVLFERKLPVRPRSGPRPGCALGHTGSSLARELRRKIEESLKRRETCGAVLVVDDLDCHDPLARAESFLQAVLRAVQNVPGTTAPPVVTGFASPELEAWVLADWNNSLARHSDFRARHEGMRHWLATDGGVDFGNLERFSHLDVEKNSCKEKMSEILCEASRRVNQGEDSCYSKAHHTAELLSMVDPGVVARNCGLYFAPMVARLNKLIGEAA